jgi:catechol-2,3-dioxygenase
VELEPLEPAPATSFRPAVDRRPRMPEPLPVKLVAVADVRLPAAAGLERKLDAFYVGLFGFERAPDESDRHVADATISYRAENFTLHLAVQEPPVRRADLRPIGVEVPSLAALESTLTEAEQEYERQRGLLPGEISIVLADPAGNWVEAVEMKSV